jgi:hypothetical protein
MVVFCPGCGSKISVEPAAPGGNVECPRCHSRFSTEGLKSAEATTPPKKFRPKKKGGGRFVGVLIVLVVVLVFGAGAAALYFSGIVGHHGPVSNTGSPNQASWQEYTNAEGRFSVLFPGTPTRDTIPPPSRLKGGKPRVVSYTVDTPSATYSVALEDFDGKETPDQFIGKQRSDLSAGRGGKLVSEKDVTVDTNRGKDFVVEVPNRGAAHIRFVAAGRRLYKLMVVGTGKPPDSHDVAKFFDSFRING